MNNITLVEMEMKYWEDIHAYASLPKVSQFKQWRPNTEENTLTYMQQVIENKKKDKPSRYVYAIKEVSQERIIGAAELFQIDFLNKSGEIGYIVHPDYWGKGIGTNVARQLLMIGFSEFHFHRIHATCDAKNIGSSRVLEKIGMTLEGRIRENILLPTGWRDSLLYSILENEWEGRKSHGTSDTRCIGTIHKGT